MTVKFLLPINEAKKTEHGLTQIFHGDIEITATVSKGADPDVEFETIKWQGVDILPMLDNFPEGAGDHITNYILTATLQHAHYLQT